MTVAAWIASSLLVVVITLVVMGAAIRPYVAALVTERDSFKQRALFAEAEIESHHGHDVTIVNPKVDTMADLDVFLKGMNDE